MPGRWQMGFNSAFKGLKTLENLPSENIILLKLSVLLCEHNFHSDGLAKMGTYVVYVDIFKPKVNFA
jgi:hypothetical protein